MNRTDSFRSYCSLDKTTQIKPETDEKILDFLNESTQFFVSINNVESTIKEKWSNYTAVGHTTGMSAEEKNNFDWEIQTFFDKSVLLLGNIEKMKSERNKQTFLVCTQVCIQLGKELKLLNSLYGKLQEDRIKNEQERIQLMPSSGLDVDMNQSDYDDDIELSAQERMLMEKENNDLMNIYKGKVAELEIIEGKLIAISELQDILQTHVELQARDIDILYEDAYTITASVNAGNKYLISAQNHYADFRKYILFFLIIMSISLLFLNWIYD